MIAGVQTARAIESGGGGLPFRLLLRQALQNGKDRKSTRLNSSHQIISYAVFCLKKKKKKRTLHLRSPEALSSMLSGDALDQQLRATRARTGTHGHRQCASPTARSHVV